MATKLTDKAKLALWQRALDTIDASLHSTLEWMDEKAVFLFADLVAEAVNTHDAIREMAEEDDVGDVTAANANAGMLRFKCYYGLGWKLKDRLEALKRTQAEVNEYRPEAERSYISGAVNMLLEVLETMGEV